MNMNYGNIEVFYYFKLAYILASCVKVKIFAEFAKYLPQYLQFATFLTQRFF